MFNLPYTGSGPLCIARCYDKALVKGIAAQMGIPRPYEGYQALLADPEIDAVYNPLPNHLHKPWSIKAAEAGKHILCEKPLAATAEDCLEMIAAARANGVQLMEAFMYRYHPRIDAARRMVEEHVIGEIHTIEAAFTFMLTDAGNIRLSPEMGGGSLMDVGCYCVNLSRLLAKREPVSVNARAHWAPSGVDVQLSGLLDFGECLIAHFDCGFNQAHRQRCLIAGSKGTLELPTAFNMGIAESQLLKNKLTGDIQIHSFPTVDMYRLMAEDFMHAITGREPAFPIEDALGNMRVIEALLTSARQNGQSVLV